MGERKIAVFPTPERAVKAMARHTCFHRQKFAGEAVPAAASAHAAQPASLTPADSMAYLKQAALPVTPFAAAANEDEAVAAARDIGFPVAVKINSPDVTHKTDVGGVVLNVADEAGVRAAFRKLAAVETAAGFRAGGALICGMAAPGVEVIVGVTRDLQFGHAVMFGMGGTMVEVLKDVSFRIVPFSEMDAAEMIAEVRGARILAGVRGAKPADVAALKKLLVQVSELVTQNPQIEELDLNPIFVSPRGVQIADARIVLASAGGASAG
jgi:acyl-CoA synthetase (NDP forming)